MPCYQAIDGPAEGLVCRVDGSTVCLTLEAPFVEVALANRLFRPS